MQTAKRTSKADVSQVIEYEQAQLALEAKKSAMELEMEEEEDKPNEEPTIVSDDDDEDLFKWFGLPFPASKSIYNQKNSHFRHKSTQSLCEVEIKDESSSESSIPPSKSTALSKKNWSKSINNNNVPCVDNFPNRFEGVQIPPMQMNDFASTMDTVNILKDRNADEQSDELKIFMEMHKKEHQVRLDLLKVQLETAKLNRDIAEINKMILLRDFQEKNDFHSK